ncbi:hypothetical protein [Nocardia sp. NPDC059195]|uniref:hypothetical protein n=1 Tax=Nocardia sp. NPDC059195 TaxID=3346765 RepID=UPI00369BF912
MSASTVELHVIARLDDGDCAADLFGWEIFYSAVDGSETGRAVTAFWESVTATAGAKDGLIALDAALADAGYQRTAQWRKHVTASGCVRYFTDAAAHIHEELP